MHYNECTNFTLEADGFEVILNLFTEEELTFMSKLMWVLLKAISIYTSKPIEETDLSTYRSLWELGLKHGMLMQFDKIGHNPISWFVRQHPNVIREFIRIYQTDRLLTSFDTLSISLPCEITNRGWYRGKEWFHTDQNFQRNGFECVQGLVNVFDVNEGDATLRVLRKSHKLHKDFQDQFQIDHSSDWCLLTPEQKQFYTDRLGPDSDICVKAPAGSLILWDSRTIHQGMEPQRGRKKPNIRCVVYVCMTPASLASQKN